ncbi:hypothetical protein ASD28_06190 [Massilia sp. Root133]|jgi:hypothetical protein|uniref:DUF1579 domain-containing protein n=2 Tax=Massilia TaxID=149698 RepID=A0A7X3G004_9BURK|nr:hypothetical protein ASD28_06190 [Massilia sp. Root133]KQZ52125.1 hypothetical protein ASD92_16305 [Massilia sp. Root1485]MVW61170.1 DUF1579 domain-containing protein [Telluria cellulosilytica]
MHKDPAMNDFDFLVGHWTVRHRRLKERLVGCTEWEEFGGTCSLRPLLDGQANVDDNVLETPSGTYRAASIRAYDPATQRWSIWWLDSRQPHDLGVPVVGAFKDGTGTFFAADTLNGQPIRVRFLWTDITAASARWQQAFSRDGGATWETNWVMKFERAVS